MPASCSAVRTATRSLGLADHLEGVAQVADLLGAGVEHGHQHVVLGPRRRPSGTTTTPLRENR